MDDLCVTLVNQPRTRKPISLWSISQERENQSAGFFAMFSSSARPKAVSESPALSSLRRTYEASRRLPSVLDRPTYSSFDGYKRRGYASPYKVVQHIGHSADTIAARDATFIRLKNLLEDNDLLPTEEEEEYQNYEMLEILDEWMDTIKMNENSILDSHPPLLIWLAFRKNWKDSTVRQLRRDNQLKTMERKLQMSVDNLLQDFKDVILFKKAYLDLLREGENERFFLSDGEFRERVRHNVLEQQKKKRNIRK